MDESRVGDSPMSRRGFTLLEVLVAMTIVGLVSIGVLGAVAASERVSDRASLTLVASELADERLASLFTLSASALADSADGRGHDVTDMPDWRWTASMARGARNLAMLSVTIRGPGVEVERHVLRPVEAVR